VLPLYQPALFFQRQSLERLRRYEENIKMYPGKIGIEDVSWTHFGIGRIELSVSITKLINLCVQKDLYKYTNRPTAYMLQCKRAISQNS
jgi:hypothetical protein